MNLEAEACAIEVAAVSERCIASLVSRIHLSKKTKGLTQQSGQTLSLLANLLFGRSLPSELKAVLDLGGLQQQTTTEEWEYVSKASEPKEEGGKMGLVMVAHDTLTRPVFRVFAKALVSKLLKTVVASLQRAPRISPHGAREFLATLTVFRTVLLSVLEPVAGNRRPKPLVVFVNNQVSLFEQVLEVFACDTTPEMYRLLMQFPLTEQADLERAIAMRGVLSLLDEPEAAGLVARAEVSAMLQSFQTLQLSKPQPQKQQATRSEALQLLTEVTRGRKLDALDALTDKFPGLVNNLFGKSKRG